MSAHTPGPWMVAPSDKPPAPMYSGIVAIVADSPGLYVVLGDGHARTRVQPDEWPANARLIAAAPALADALQAFISPTYESPANAAMITLTLTMTAAGYHAARAALRAAGRLP
jgi:hypothetical protein